MSIIEQSTDPIFILNEKNILITEEYINGVFKKYHINHTITHIKPYVTATTHTSYSISTYESHKVREVSATKLPRYNKAVPIQNESYERLEYLGDSIIHAILAEYIFNRFSDQQEGFMTKLRTKLENSETLAKFSRVIGLDAYVLLSRYIEETGGRSSNVHILEDVFEAFIGAIFTDGGTTGNNFEVCKSLVIQLIESEIDIAELLFNETNYKDILLRYAHEQKMPDPKYGTHQVTGKENKVYSMFVSIGNKICGYGNGNSKKEGEQMAAKEALTQFQVLHDSDDCSDDEYMYYQDSNN